jgi:hypothetical protein
MRTTFDLPKGLGEAARRLLGSKSRTDTIVLALTELIRRRLIDELKAMAGGHQALDRSALLAPPAQLGAEGQALSPSERAGLVSVADTSSWIEAWAIFWSPRSPRRRGAAVWSVDGDFDRMARIGLDRLFAA